MGAIKNIKLSALKEKYNGRIFIETGSGYGTGIYEALRSNFDLVLSVEIDKEQTELLQKVFRFDQKVQIFNALCRDFLSQILPQININTPCVIFLDAHFPGADLNKKAFSSEKNESIRMPLYEELQIVKKLRIDKGAKDLIIVDDIMLYDDDNQYEASHQKQTMDILPREHRNYLNKFISLYEASHTSTILKSEQGWLILEPK